MLQAAAPAADAARASTIDLSIIAGCMLVAVGSGTLLLPRPWLLRYTAFALLLSRTPAGPVLQESLRGCAVQASGLLQAVLQSMQLPIAFGLSALCMHVVLEHIAVRVLRSPLCEAVQTPCFVVVHLGDRKSVV